MEEVEGSTEEFIKDNIKKVGKGKTERMAEGKQGRKSNLFMIHHIDPQTVGVAKAGEYRSLLHLLFCLKVELWLTSCLFCGFSPGRRAPPSSLTNDQGQTWDPWIPGSLDPWIPGSLDEEGGSCVAQQLFP